PQGLERAGGRVEPRFATRDRGTDDVGQLRRPPDWSTVARRGDRPRHATGIALLAEGADQRGQFLLGEPRDEIGRGLALAPHAHVERAVGREREAALGAAKLHRRHAEIEGDAGDRPRRDRRDKAFHVAEPTLDYGEPAL